VNPLNTTTTPTEQTQLVRLNKEQVSELGGMGHAHALLIACHPRPGAPMAAYAAPLMFLEDKTLLKTFSYLQATSVLSAAQVRFGCFRCSGGSSEATEAANERSESRPRSRLWKRKDFCRAPYLTRGAVSASARPP